MTNGTWVPARFLFIKFIYERIINTIYKRDFQVKKRKPSFKKFLSEDIDTIWNHAGIKFQKAWKTIGPEDHAEYQEYQEKGALEELPPPPDEGEGQPADTEDEYDEDKFNGNEEGDVDLSDTEDVSEEDPNKQGIIRYVKGAHLVYKRQNEQGTYDELWVFPISDDGKHIRNELEMRHSILSGTDIPGGEKVSADGSQKFELTTVGNAQLLRIMGLPN